MIAVRDRCAPADLAGNQERVPSGSSRSASRRGAASPPRAARAGRQAGRLPAQVGQDRQYPAVIFGRGQQAELGEQVPDVRLDGLG